MKTAVEFYREELNSLVSLRESKFKTEQEIFEQAKEMEKEQKETHKYTEFDIISAFEYGWNQYGWNEQQYGIMDEDMIHRIQKRLIQSLNKLKQQEQ